jgi:hypothetical protein
MNHREKIEQETRALRLSLLRAAGKLTSLSTAKQVKRVGGHAARYLGEVDKRARTLNDPDLFQEIANPKVAAARLEATAR